MEKITYLIGAGFSAPLGLPVMSNFLNKSKDLYSSNTDLDWFSRVFQLIRELSVAKNYYNTDLFNIEEIISILEMESFLGGGDLDKVFSDYIKETISRYTPNIEIPALMASNWHDGFFHGRKMEFMPFFMHLTRMKFFTREREISKSIIDQGARYSVISLNYDMVIENFISAINNSFFKGDPVELEKKKYDPTWSKIHLAKLHGTVEEGEIVPPTWAKGTHRSIVPVWKMASEILRDSNHIRFIGYSLPLADSYLKYLLKSSVLKSERLKSIDVICSDYDGSVKQRYRDFFNIPNFRFANCSFMDLQTAFAKQFVPASYGYNSVQVSPEGSEAEYEKFMSAHWQ